MDCNSKRPELAWDLSNVIRRRHCQIAGLLRSAKEGMPVRRESRNVVANPEELNQWLQRTSGEVITPGSDLLKDLRASVAAQTGTKLGQSAPRAPPPVD
jgi:hypothetical protein